MSKNTGRPKIVSEAEWLAARKERLEAAVPSL
jgi:hypothetical protein